MVDCKNDFGSGDYREVLETGLKSPLNGEALFIGVHNECRGATVFEESSMPNISDVSSFAGYATDANLQIRDTIEGAAGEMLSAYQHFIGDPQLRQAIGSINLFDPGVNDISSIQNGIAAVYQTAENAKIGASDLEYDELTSITDRLQTAGSDLNALVETNDHYAVMSASIDALEKMQIPAAEIQQAMQVEANINADIVAPSVTNIKP